MNAAEALRSALTGHLSAMSLDSVIRRALAGNDAPVRVIAQNERERLATGLESSIALFSTTERSEIRRIVRGALALEGTSAEAPIAGDTREELAVRTEVDVNVARSAARRIALAIGLRSPTAVKIATAVSELARNIVLYAGTGTITLESAGRGDVATVRVTSRDDGPGIDPVKLEAVLGGSYVSKSGLGKGIAAVRRIADRFEITSKLGIGTTIVAEFRGD